VRLAKFIVATGLLIAVVVGCNGASSARGPGSTATHAVGERTATPSVIPTVPPSEDGSEITVGLDKNGQSIQLRVGQTFLLALGADLNWAVAVTDQTVVSRVPNITVVRGAQGVYRALRTGSTNLTGIGDPPCRSVAPPCAAPSLLFSLSISVIE
jgi:hypothetical protein